MINSPINRFDVGCEFYMISSSNLEKEKLPIIKEILHFRFICVCSFNGLTKTAVFLIFIYTVREGSSCTDKNDFCNIFGILREVEQINYTRNFVFFLRILLFNDF